MSVKRALRVVPSCDRGRDVAGLPRAALARELREAGGSETRANEASTRFFRYVHRTVPLELPRIDEEVLLRLGIGRWAWGALLDRDPSPKLTIDQRVTSSDGTERLVLRAFDGSLIETIVIPATNPHTHTERTTVCISTQVGCARGCTFFETAKLGLVRQLDATEIVDQVRIARTIAPKLSNIVFMGMGEPFDNLASVADATHVLTDHDGLAFAASRITVSTVGVADKIERFYATCRAELAVSLNAPDDARRSEIMPVNRRFDMAELKRAIAAHKPASRKVLFEYVLIRGFNDADADAHLVADYVSGLRARVNVIPLNPGGDPALRSPDDQALDRFVGALAARGVTALVRRPRGRAIGGACGQLAGARRTRSMTAADRDASHLEPTEAGHGLGIGPSTSAIGLMSTPSHE